LRFNYQLYDVMTRLEQLMKYLGDAPNDSFLLFALAKEHEGLGDIAEAFVYYNRLVTDHPKDVGTYYHLGKLYEKVENEAAAVAIYTQGMQIAQQLGERHAYGELATAKNMISDDDF
jgi:tetratricopeptide (TPR) repeat protein